MAPVPNREDDLARPRSRKGGKNEQEVTRGVARETTVPEADPDWHPIATMLWNSLVTSGQSDFYQDSDWAFAYSLCEDLSMYKKPLFNQKTGEEYYKRSGQMLQTIYTALSNLLVTEADRRRVKIELEAPKPVEEAASVSAIADYRNDLGLGEA